MTQRGAETLVYSARGELLERTAVGNTVAYAYDGYGRRVGRKNGSENWSQYLYADPQNAYPVTATRDPGGVLTTYHYDDFGHLFAFQRGVDWYYVAADQVGTPRVVSDATGNIIKTLDYDSYGVLIADSNPGFDLPIGFAGGISDRVTGLVRFGARDYDPAIGRWTAKDPILFESEQFNLYGYVLNNPVSSIDPSGLGGYEVTTSYGNTHVYANGDWSGTPQANIAWPEMSEFLKKMRLEHEEEERVDRILAKSFSDRLRKDPKCVNLKNVPIRIRELMVKLHGTNDPMIEKIIKNKEETRKIRDVDRRPGNSGEFGSVTSTRG